MYCTICYVLQVYHENLASLVLSMQRRPSTTNGITNHCVQARPTCSSLPRSHTKNFALHIGARFGPRAIRAGSSRQTPKRAFNPRAGINPYASWATILDCGDMPITPFDNGLALTQMTAGYRELLSRPGKNIVRPRLVTLGGDHSLALPALRALNEIYGKVTVLHFDGKSLQSPTMNETTPHTLGEMLILVTTFQHT